jgi:hypothetical protein
MAKPRGKTPTLLSQSTGKPSVYLCKRKTKCSRCKEIINSGDDCFRIPKQVSGFTNKKTCCIVCFRLIINQTKDDLVDIETALINIEKHTK